MSKHVSVVWDGTLEFEATDDGGATVTMGNAPEGHGPAALVLAALAGCSGMDVATIMSKKKVAFESYRIEVNGQQRMAYPRLYTSIVVEHIIIGSDIDDKAVARSIELSARKYCVVGATLASGATAIDHRVRISDERGERTLESITVGPHGKGLDLTDDA